ncbi:S41 family peptidase [Flavitalea sp.]|nr:S41 family peptidase [Flavitalea sp.]
MQHLTHHINKWILAGLLIFGEMLNLQQANAQQLKNHPGTGGGIPRLVEEIDGLIHKYGLYKDSLNWKQIYNEINSIRFTDSDTSNLRLVLNVFTQNLRKAGDKHSFFMTTAAATSYSKREEAAAKPTAKDLGSGIALVTVPLCFNNQKSKDIRFANTIREQIRKVDTRNDISVWMIDLRNNVGGNMWPMLAGLNALIEDGTAGYFINPASNSEQPWPSYNGRLVFPNAKINNYKVRSRDIKIALLIDSMTASSGEMTAVSFIGLPNVKVLGQPSAGYTTANTTYYLSDGTMFNLATSYIADRNRKPYMDKIIPDIILSKNGDGGIEEAVKIIKEWMLQTAVGQVATVSFKTLYLN